MQKVEAKSLKNQIEQLENIVDAKQKAVKTLEYACIQDQDRLKHLLDEQSALKLKNSELTEETTTLRQEKSKLRDTCNSLEEQASLLQDKF